METVRPLIVLPTYNEAENLPAIVGEVLALPERFDVLVIDDNSPDGTGAIADGLAAAHDQVHVLHRPGKQGLGTAYIAGFRWALERGYGYVLEMDADFSHQPRYLPTFLQEVAAADLVLGSRYVPGGGTRNWSWLRRFISAGGNHFARAMLGLRTHDCTGGFRCYRASLLARIPWEEVQLRGYGFQVGAVYHAERLGARVREFPIIFEDRRVGQSKMSRRIVAEAFLYVTRTALRDRLGLGRGPRARQA